MKKFLMILMLISFVMVYLKLDKKNINYDVLLSGNMIWLHLLGHRNDKIST